MPLQLGDLWHARSYMPRERLPKADAALEQARSRRDSQA
jgi:hypothetical protein